MAMVRFWVGFALVVAALAAVWHAVGAPVGPVRVSIDPGIWSSKTEGETGSGVSASQARTVGAFKRIHAEGAAVIDVEVRDGLAHTVEVRSDDNLLKSVRTEVVGDSLEISLEG